MKTKTKLSIIESPLQFLNSLEWYSESSFKVLFIDLGNERNKKIIEFACNYFDIPLQIISFRSRSYTLNSILSGIKCLGVLLQYDEIVIGDFRNFHFSVILKSLFLLNKKAVLVDDGNNVLNSKNEIEKFKNKGLEIFSAFLTDESTKNNKYEYLKSLVQSNRKLKDTDIVIGSSIVQNNALSEADYFQFLHEINRISTKAIYVPHRNETREQILKISKITNFEIKILNAPIELIFMSDLRPKNIFGICSSAMITMDLIYADMTINILIAAEKWKNNTIGHKMKNIEQSYAQKAKMGDFKNQIKLIKTS